MRIGFTHGGATRHVGIRALTYGGFALLLVIIVASSAVTLSTVRQLGSMFADLQHLRSANDLSAEIDRRMAALRLAARDVVAEGAGDVGPSVAQADLLAGSLAAAGPQLSREERDMVDGMSQRLTAYRAGLVQLAEMVHARSKALARLKSAATATDDAVARLLGQLPANASSDTALAAARLLAAERRQWFGLADPAGFDQPAAASAAGDTSAAFAALRAAAANALGFDAIAAASSDFGEAAATLGRTNAEINQLNTDVLGTEGRLIARTTELLRQSGSRAERGLGEQLTAALRGAASRGLVLGAICVLFGLGCAFFVTRRTVAPLRNITGAMRRLAAGELRTDVPYLDDATEIGAMARATDVFKRAMVEVGAARDQAGEAEATAAESRRWLQQLIDTLPATITVKDARLRFVLINAYAAQVFGTATEAAVGKTTNELLAHYGADKSDAFDRQVLEDRQELGFYEDQYPDAVGTMRYWLTKKVPLLDAVGEITHIVTVALDIAERKKAEAALLSSDERYALAMDAVNEGVYDWNLDIGEIYYSPRIYAALHVTAAQVSTPGDWLERIHPEDRPRYEAATLAHFRGETPRFECEYRYLSSDGEWRWARQHGIARRDARGRARRMAGSTGDITELKNREHDLAEAARLRDALLGDLNAVIDSIDYGLLFMGPDLRARVVNRAFRQMWGIPDAFIAGNPTMAELIASNRHSGLYDVTEAQFDAFVASRIDAIRAGNIAPVEMCRGDGRVLRYEGIVLADGGRLLTYLDITETKRREADLAEALDYQTGSTEVLSAIAGSAHDLQAVLKTVVTTAAALCRADNAIIYRYESGAYYYAVGNDIPEEYEALERDRPLLPGVQTVVGRTALAGQTTQILDAWTDPDYGPKDEAQLGNVRSMLGVPLVREGRPIGVLALGRAAVEPFSDKQVQLVTTFADQVVIAVESARLIAEQREALDQQAAAAEVLAAINSSSGNLGPVFDALLEKATRLCDAPAAILWSFDDHGDFVAAATYGLSPAFASFLREWKGTMPSVSLDAIAGGQPYVHNLDLASTESYRQGNVLSRAVADLGGGRSGLLVGFRKDGVLMGGIRLYRHEVRPFTDKQIALLQNFAAQAVVAIENARLITETREALEQQTATAQVIQTINNSPGDLAPIFDALLEAATRLCAASLGVLWRYDGEHFQVAATRGAPPAYLEYVTGRRFDFAPGTGMARMLEGAAHAQWLDASTDEVTSLGEVPRTLQRLSGSRTMLFVPLKRDENFLGVFTIYRREVRAFTDKQLALLQNLAAQAVIAIENAQLVIETHEALKKQTATAEILRVISGSPTNLQPTFDAIAANATALCGAAGAGVFRFDGSLIHLGAYQGWTDAAVAAVKATFPLPPGRGSVTARAVLTRSVIRQSDLTADAEYTHPGITAAGHRATMSIPMLRDGEPLGAITVTRDEAEGFSDAQIDLLRMFADQAVIAIENVRLFNELGDRTRDLQEALEHQTAVSDALRLLSQSGAGLKSVLDTLVETATRICAGDHAFLYRLEGNRLALAAAYGITPEHQELVERNPPAISRGTLAGRTIIERREIQMEDALADPAYTYNESRQLGQFRTQLGIPLISESKLIGALCFARTRVDPFTKKQIDLIRTFADQAVIAMENARLFAETQEALEQQTATAQALQVINASPGNLVPVFATMLDRAIVLCDAAFGTLWTFDGESMQVAASQHVPPEYQEYLARGPHKPGPNAHARLIRGAPFVQLADVTLTDGYRNGDPLARALADLARARTLLAVPLRKDDRLLGVFGIYRQEVRPFSGKQIALVQNFAAQAVIAMENARLLAEIRQRQQELRVTFDNMADGVAMFDEELRLAAWNRNFQELLDLPGEFFAEHHTFDEYILYLAEHGEFGETSAEAQIGRLRARVGEHYRFERARPDGRVLEVRHNPMPDGGFVLIYGDITERKRSEEEIRAARDAAEAAYRDLQTAQVSLVQAQKMAALGQLTAGIAHEIKNPLNFVNNFASLSAELLDELKDKVAPALDALDAGKREEVDETIETLTGNLEKVVEHGQRADNIVKSMLEHSRGVSSERRTVDLNNLIDEALNLAYHGARAQDISFDIAVERAFDTALAPVALAPQEMTRVFLNLFGNGFYAANKRMRENEDRSFRPTLSVATHDLGDAVEVRVRDNGTGIPPDIRDKLFQPFFTTKPTGEGTGLGLSISYDIVTQQHGGTISVDSEVGAFTVFTIRLPRGSPARANGPSA